jgi:hypothetical protein
VGGGWVGGFAWIGRGGTWVDEGKGGSANVCMHACELCTCACMHAFVYVCADGSMHLCVHVSYAFVCECVQCMGSVAGRAGG